MLKTNNRSRSHTRKLGSHKRDELPSTVFAFPKQRKEPLTDARHVRNALARFDQVEDVSDKDRAAAFGKIKRAAKRFGVYVTEKSWRDLDGKSKTARSRSPARKKAK